MDQDENPYRGVGVTKPIDIKTKNANLSSAGQTEKLAAKVDNPKIGNPKKDLPNGASQDGTVVKVLPVGRKAKGSPSPEMIDLIGHRLASIYNSVVSQPVPDRFLDLLAQLEAGEHQAGAPRMEAEKPAKETSAKKERT
jgi:hypothetical protein